MLFILSLMNVFWSSINATAFEVDLYFVMGVFSCSTVFCRTTLIVLNLLLSKKYMRASSLTRAIQRVVFST